MKYKHFKQALLFKVGSTFKRNHFLKWTHYRIINELLLSVSIFFYIFAKNKQNSSTEK